VSRGEDVALASALVMLLLLLWSGFVVHASPQFPGSVVGGVVGIAAATLMWVPTLWYSLAKRSVRIRQALPRRLPMRELLKWHVRLGILGAILAILHSAHRFESPVGIVLTGLLLVAVTTGYVGRYFLGLVASDLRQKTADLVRARALFSSFAAVPESSVDDSIQRALAEAIVDLEYTVTVHDHLSGRAATWLRVHLVVSLAFLAVFVLHVSAAIYLGLRWW